MGNTFPENNYNMDGNAIPVLFSFIVYRRERVGGFLFNPYLFKEIPINNIELRILDHCNGHFSVNEIKDIILKEFSLPNNLAQKYVAEAFMVFKRSRAINFKNEKRSTQEFPVSSNYSLHSSYSSASSNYLPENNILSAPLSVLWEITNECNLSCKHCLINAGKQEQNEMSLEEVKKIIDELAELKVFNITFGGGEPLLRNDFLDIVDYASRFNFGIKLSTNGVLVDDALLDRLKETNVFSVQVSVDGLEQTHNAFRGSKKSFEKAVSALKSFSNAGYWTIMSTAITKYNVNEIEQLVELAIECGASSFKASPFIPVGKGKENIKDLAITPFEIKNLANKIMQTKDKYEKRIDLQLDGIFPWLIESCFENRRNAVAGASQVGCSAGTSNLVITPTGNVIPCPFFIDLIAGNIRKTSLQDIWYNSDIFDIFRNLDNDRLEGKCSNCEYIPQYCQGGCRAAAFALSGNLLAQDPYCFKSMT
ncbi:MAG: radical SAM protein [ANME-2 cluster archaeon]|nr:radical SAM protein [ANME-2 cluster archaeon]